MSRISLVWGAVRKAVVSEGSIPRSGSIKGGSWCNGKHSLVLRDWCRFNSCRAGGVGSTRWSRCSRCGAANGGFTGAAADDHRSHNRLVSGEDRGLPHLPYRDELSAVDPQHQRSIGHQAHSPASAVRDGHDHLPSGHRHHRGTRVPREAEYTEYTEYGQARLGWLRRPARQRGRGGTRIARRQLMITTRGLTSGRHCSREASSSTG